MPLPFEGHRQNGDRSGGGLDGDDRILLLSYRLEEPCFQFALWLDTDLTA